VDEDGNVYVAEGPASLSDAGSAFTKYVVAGMYVGPRFRRVGRGQVPSHNEAWISGGQTPWRRLLPAVLFQNSASVKS